MAPVLLLATAFGLGFLHGLGADHLMGIAALSVAPHSDPSTHCRRTFAVALKFAVGHALLLGIGASALILLGWSLPVVFERGGEVLGGVLLIGLGAVGAWGAATGRVYGHTHPHRGEPAAHWHLHIGGQGHHPIDAAHSHLPTIIGAAFAVSSLRALTTLAPFGGQPPTFSLALLLGLITVFAIGIVISMSLFGIALARMLSAPVVRRASCAVVIVMAVGSIAMGLYWIVSAIIGG